MASLPPFRKRESSGVMNNSTSGGIEKKMENT